MGEEYNLEGFCAPLRARGLEIYNFKNIILYRIYHANTWGKNIFLRVSVHPYGRRVGKYTISIILVCTGYIMPTIMCIVGNVHVNNINQLNTCFHIDNSSDGKFKKLAARWRCTHSISNQFQLNPVHLQVYKTPR